MITFYFQAKDIGGVQVLIFNLIKELYLKNVITKLIYFKDSWLSNELEKNEIYTEFYNIETVEFNKLSKIIKNDDILVTTLLLDEYFFLKKTNPSVLFWNVFPTTLEIEKSKIDFIRKYFRRRLIKKMTAKKGLIFMDPSGINFIKNEFGLTIKPNIIQIPVNVYEENGYLTNRKTRFDNEINITYLGRAILWKVTPVIKLIEDIHNCNLKNYKIVLHIITDDIEEFKQLLNITNKSFELKYYSNISGDNLKKFLLEISDIHFAMGTSCLEGSLLGIPSILLDASFTPFPKDYKYRWIFENENYSLGVLLDNSAFVSKGHPLTEILSYYDKTNRNELIGISTDCYEYTKKNHDLKTVANSFLSACLNSELKMNNILTNDAFYLNRNILSWLIRSFKI